MNVLVVLGNNGKDMLRSRYFHYFRIISFSIYMQVLSNFPLPKDDDCQYSLNCPSEFVEGCPWDCTILHYFSSRGHGRSFLKHRTFYQRMRYAKFGLVNLEIYMIYNIFPYIFHNYGSLSRWCDPSFVQSLIHNST